VIRLRDADSSIVRSPVLTEAIRPHFLYVFPALNTVSNLYLKAEKWSADTLSGGSFAERDPRIIEPLMPR
jgi:hypothetical protein